MYLYHFKIHLVYLLDIERMKREKQKFSNKYLFFIKGSLVSESPFIWTAKKV